ncbi:hypothetical protein [Pedobacter gandavensis]|uniref:hypothetical protein n=1 Tax=Pedobacter gandavensis TaxID=2679963 RepID=UPI0029318E95|nr:hypothetical protein [Pedobacter gandavensis]
MKHVLIVFALVILYHSPINAQDIRSYLVVVKTKSVGNAKGVLYNVSPNAIILQNGDSIIAIGPTEIKKIIIFASNKPYKYKKVFNYTPWDENNFETRPNEQVRIRKWGQPDPTIKEEVGGHISNAAMNGVVNLIAAPLSVIKGSLYTAIINEDVNKFNSIRNDLYKYSIYYQLHTDYKDELKKINSITNRTNE